MNNPAAPMPAVTAPSRLASIDAYRGFVMFLMMGEVLRLARVAQAVPESGFWNFVAGQQTHVPWVGCTLHDLIQPSFSFLVGVALPFSIASRAARGHSQAAMTWHAVWRALLLVLLGVFLRSTGANNTNWTFEDTLSQIGLGYGFLFALGFQSLRVQWGALALILVGYWALFALYPLPAADFDYAKVGVTQAWLETNGHQGFAAHWQKNSNAAWAFDTWFMNLFERERPYVSNRGGYVTLSFIPTLGTMILGLIAGGILRSGRAPRERIRWFVIAGGAALAAGWLLGALGICPVVKRIWTPSWTLFSGGWCLLLLAAFYGVIDVWQRQRWPEYFTPAGVKSSPYRADFVGAGRDKVALPGGQADISREEFFTTAKYPGWAFPLVVIGANSIAAYLIAHLFEPFILKNLVTHLGAGPFKVFGDAYQPFVLGAVALFVMWLLLYWMYRRKVWLKI